MREEVLDLLIKSRKTFNQIIDELSIALPENILQGSRNSVEVQIPKFANNFIHILNKVEQKKLYSENNNIDEAIEVFSNPDLDVSIEKTIQNTSIIVETTEGSMSAHETLQACLEGIDSGFQLLNIQLKVGKLN